MERRLLVPALFLALAGCAPAKMATLSTPSTDQVQNLPGEPADPGVTTPGSTKTVTLSEAYNLRTLKAGVLETVDTLPVGAEVEVVDGGTINYPYRNDAGQSAFSSTGFLQITSIQKVPSSTLSAARIAELMKLSGGLYVSSLVGQSTGETGLTIPALTDKSPGAGFQKYFSDSGKPKVSYSASMVKRFGSLLNKGLTMDQLSASDRTKWSKIMAEMQKATDRTKAVPRTMMFVDTALGQSRSLDFEKKKTVSKEGAWTIAVEGTAKRLGFANVPCAEFVSEVIREAYARAGYSHFDDFNDARGNRLDYYAGAAAVVNLTDFLANAGWIPWDPSVYVPPVGVPMMHATAKTPGHAYLSGGENGRYIVDNGTPQGRDLRASTENTISIMYQHGVFFLPPGFIPAKWSP